MGKLEKIFDEIVLEHHPILSDQPELADFFEYEEFNIEHMVEKCMAHVGGYDFVDAAHYDNSDGTETKTASVFPTARLKNGKRTASFTLEISNVCSQAGVVKSGDLRVVLYNPHSDTLRFYFIPVSDLGNTLHITRHPTTKQGKINATWNSSTDECRKLDPYEVEDFVTLASIPSTQRST